MPYRPLSSFYFFYFASLGAFMPYWGLYLEDLGFAALAIGQLTAILTATKIVAPNVWGWIGDHTGRRMAIVRLAAAAALLSFCGLYLAKGFWTIALVMTVFTFFWNASLPQVEVVTCNHLGARMRRYASIRLWGSIGFIVTVMTLGKAVGYWGASVILPSVTVLFAGVWLSSLAINEPSLAPQATIPEAPLMRTLRRPEVVAFLTSGMLMQASHGAFYTFYSIYLVDAGYGGTTIGLLWAFGVAAEVAVFARMHWLLVHFGARSIFIASIGLAIARWLLIGHFVSDLLILVVAQTLHAATFGAFHATAIHLTHHYFVGPTQGRGQALYNSASFGVGGALGSLISGMLWADVGPEATFGMSALFAAVSLAVAWRFVDRDGRY